MNKIMNDVGRHDYYYLTRQGYNTHLEKLQAVSRIMAEEWIDGIDQLIFLNALKAKLCQVKAKNPDLQPNKMLFGPNNAHNGISGLTHMDVMEFEKGFSHDPDHEQNVRNSYQADHNQNY